MHEAHIKLLFQKLIFPTKIFPISQFLLNLTNQTEKIRTFDAIPDSDSKKLNFYWPKKILRDQKVIIFFQS
jgi:hypothetical protein